ncbi:MAG TPA: TolC family outer membrane protein, partial [Pseudomonadales bacterium]|nr:TolC family outer membrane protein [Pseudomonadales bacterium]
MNAKRVIPLLIGLTIGQQSIAADLLETYELASRNDPDWAAKKAEFFSNKEYVNLAKSALLPQIVAGAFYSRNTYKGATFNLNQNDISANLSQLSQNAPKYQSTCTTNGNLDWNCVAIAALTDAGAAVLGSAQEERSQSFTRKGYGIQITQPLLRMNLWYTYDKAKAAGLAAQAKLAAEEQNMMMRVVDLYFGNLRAQEEYTYAKSQQASLSALAEGMKQRYQLGLGRASDVYEVQAQLDVANIELLGAETKMNSMRSALAAYTRQSDYAVDPLPDNIPVEPPVPADPKQWEEQALANNYEIVAAQYIVDAADKQVMENLTGHMPTVDLVAQAAHNEYGAGFTPSSDTTQIGLEMIIPIYSGGATDTKTKQARYQREQAKETLRTKRLLTQQNVNNYYATVATRAKSIELGRDAIQSTEQAYETTKSGYSAGGRQITDVLTAQNNLYKAKK